MISALVSRLVVDYKGKPVYLPYWIESYTPSVNLKNLRKVYSSGLISLKKHGDYEDGLFPYKTICTIMDVPDYFKSEQVKCFKYEGDIFYPLY